MWTLCLLLQVFSVEASTPADVAQTAEVQVNASLNAILESIDDGDREESITLANAWLANSSNKKHPRRMGVRFLLGTLYFQSQQWDLASDSFYRVRKRTGPLTPLALWYEAISDLRRGRPASTIKECELYRSEWPEGEFSDDCLLLIGRAHAAQKHHTLAKAAWKEWLKENPDHPRNEQVQLDITIANAQLGSKAAIKSLQNFTIYHAYPSIGQHASKALEDLESTGVKLPQLSTTKASLQSILSQVRAGQYEPAWNHFLQTLEQHGDDPEVQEWLDRKASDIAWRSRSFETYVELSKAQYQKTPNGYRAWRIFKALQRSGDQYAAGMWAEEALIVHKKHSKWKDAHSMVAHTWLIAGEYEKAHASWEKLSRQKGNEGKKARWFSAFSLYRLGHCEKALPRLEAIERSDKSRRVAAQYYQAKTHDCLQQPEQAKAIRQKILNDSPLTWYGQLLQSAHKIGLGPVVTGQKRSGTWVDKFQFQQPVSPITAYLPDTNDDEKAAPPKEDTTEPALSVPNASAPTHVAPPQRPLPNSYGTNPLFDAATDLKNFRTLVESGKELWPNLILSLELAQVGLYEAAAPYVSESFSEWETAMLKGRGARVKAIRALPITSIQWRSSFRATRDHHNSARAAYSLPRAKTQAQLSHRRAMTHPTAHIEKVSRYSQENGIDRLLVLGLMRQESYYRRAAESRVGATGLMQVMPKTGSKIAYDLDETFFPDQLGEPDTNIRYGIWYLGKLVERFEGGWPLAVAAYNAGPMNVSSWYTRWEGQIEIDDFVEQIPFVETRDYVKKVGEHYAHYVDIYAPEDFLVIPKKPGHNKPGIVAY